MPGIRSLIGMSRLLPIHTFQCSTSRKKLNANRKAISERTSYYQVRLAFHSLPQIIRWFCTTNRFGPPAGFHRHSPCPWQAHLASGLSNTPINALLTLGFPVPSDSNVLRQGILDKSLAHSSIGTPSPRAILLLRGAPTPCRQTVSGSISPPSPGCFSPFPHGTCSLSVLESI